MNTESQNRHMMKMLMEYNIYRLLLATYRCNGYERAECHLNLAAIYVAARKCISIDAAKRDDLYMVIHDATSDLTSKLDKIGLKRDEENDFDDLSYKFFDKFMELADAEYNWRENEIL